MRADQLGGSLQVDALQGDSPLLADGGRPGGLADDAHLRGHHCSRVRAGDCYSVANASQGLLKQLQFVQPVSETDFRLHLESATENAAIGCISAPL